MLDPKTLDAMETFLLQKKELTKKHCTEFVNKETVLGTFDSLILEIKNKRLSIEKELALIGKTAEEVNAGNAPAETTEMVEMRRKATIYRCKCCG